jgi:hypothetical protein
MVRRGAHISMTLTSYDVKDLLDSHSTYYLGKNGDLVTWSFFPSDLQAIADEINERTTTRAYEFEEYVEESLIDLLTRYDKDPDADVGYLIDSEDESIAWMARDLCKGLAEGGYVR